jgi:hypothetical protein
VEVVLPGAQHREADEGEVCAIKTQCGGEDTLATSAATREFGQVLLVLNENGADV